MALTRLWCCKAGVFCLALAAAGCSSNSTPLPDLKPSVSTSMSQKEQQKAVDELNQKRQTHEQDAERQIEEQR
ncbi:MAG TPA: hypothetical protein VIG38_09005 [Hyphomicrobium sp.]|jgi:hypothetical protein